jgi:hypothetical protein
LSPTPGPNSGPYLKKNSRKKRAGGRDLSDKPAEQAQALSSKTSTTKKREEVIVEERSPSSSLTAVLTRQGTWRTPHEDRRGEDSMGRW